MMLSFLLFLCPKVVVMSVLVVPSKVDKVREVVDQLTAFFKDAVATFGGDLVISELMAYRSYNTQEMLDTLREVGVFKIDYLSDLTLAFPSVTLDTLKTWGLVNDKGTFILGGRYVLPIRNISGKVIALVGWHPKGGARKYVTTPTFCFSRDVSFFNLDCYRYAWEKWDGTVFLVEGIFDTLSLRSLGLPAIGNQGLEMSKIKSIILSRFGKVISFPDNDSAGRSVNPYTNAVSGKGTKFIWRITNNNVFGYLPQGVKDMDDFIKYYDCRADLIKCIESNLVKKLKIDNQPN